MGAAIVPHDDTAPVFEPPEHDFDFVPLFVKCSVVIDGDFAVLLAGDAGRDTTHCKGRAEPVGIIAAISQQLFGRWQ